MTKEYHTVSPEVYLGLSQDGKNLLCLSLDTSSLEIILHQISDRLGIPTELIKSQSRKRELVTARMIAMGISYKFTKFTLKKIGEFYSGRDHSTVIYNINLFDELLEVKDPILVSTLKHLRLYDKLINNTTKNK